MKLNLEPLENRDCPSNLLDLAAIAQMGPLAFNTPVQAAPMAAPTPAEMAAPVQGPTTTSPVSPPWQGSPNLMAAWVQGGMVDGTPFGSYHDLDGSASHNVSVWLMGWQDTADPGFTPTTPTQVASQSFVTNGQPFVLAFDAIVPTTPGVYSIEVDKVDAGGSVVQANFVQVTVLAN